MMDAIVVRYGEPLFLVLFLGVLFAPVMAYLSSGWAARRREILSAFTEGTVQRYLETFFPAELESMANAERNFRRHYHRRFGRRHFVIPGLCLFAISGFFLVLVSASLRSWLLGQSDPQLVLPSVAVAAVAGAYRWVLYDVMRRARARDLSPPDLFWGAFRFAVAVPLGFAFAALFKENVGLFLAFMVGAFPTKELLTMIRRVAAPKLNLVDYVKEASRELESLQGVGSAEAERYGDEGVGTILQLAYCDPVDMTIRTSFSFSYVVDCCSQALAWIYFEGDMARMKRFGLRGAQEIHNLISDIDEPDPNGPRDPQEITRQARAQLQVLARELGLDSSALERAAREIAGDPYVLFLCNVWQMAVEEEDESGRTGLQE